MSECTNDVLFLDLFVNFDILSRWLEHCIIQLVSSSRQTRTLGSREVYHRHRHAGLSHQTRKLLKGKTAVVFLGCQISGTPFCAFETRLKVSKEKTSVQLEPFEQQSDWFDRRRGWKSIFYLATFMYTLALFITCSSSWG